MHSLNSDPRELFQAVADFTRVRILRLLIESKEELCLCEFVDSLAEPQYNLSKHLKILRQAGILTATKEGRWVYHGLAKKPAHLERLYSLIADLPDSDKSFGADLERFGNRKPLRSGGRCRTETKPAAISAKRPRKLAQRI